MKNRFINSFAVVGLVSFIGSSTVYAAPVSIDFDDGTAGSPVGSFYSGLGVTFSNTQFVDNFGLAGSSSPLGIAGMGGSWTYEFGIANAIEATFSSLVSSVTITGVDVGHAGMQMDAFDSYGALIDTNNWYGTDEGVGQWMTISVANPTIASVLLYQPSPMGDDGMVFDNMIFAPVPEPETYAMLLAGLGLLGFMARRREETAA